MDTTAPYLDPTRITARTVEPEHLYTLYELENMPFEALEELYRAIPPDTQDFFESTLRESLRKRYNDEFASEAEQLELIGSCLDLYQEEHPRVPLDRYEDGIRWVGIPPRVLDQYKEDTLAEKDGKTASKPAEQSSARPYIIAGALVLAGLCLVFTLMRALFAPSAPTTAELTATSIAATQFALVPPTPTPLALENIDRPIGAGQDLRSRYPVILEITRADGTPRVFAVQQKKIDIAEWDYTSDTDVASSILGLSIRPVLGIPYSSYNKTFLESLAPGDQVTLRMSTNQSLRFAVSRSERVAPQTAEIFSQTSPGLVLVLLAEPAPSRLVIYGSYQTDQEAASSTTPSNNQAASVEQPVTHGDSGVIITALSANTTSGSTTSPLPPEWNYLLVDIRIQTAQDINTSTLIFQLLDQTGIGYSPVGVDPTITTFPPFNGPQLSAGDEIRTTLGFLVPAGTRSAQLIAQVAPEDTPVHYNLSISDTTALAARDLDVQILSIQTEGKPDEGGALLVQARIYNPYQDTITLRSPDVYIVYSPSILDKEFPVGPSVAPKVQEITSLPLTVKGGKAYDTEFRFDWRGDRYVGLAIGGYQFVATLY
ncbi:MAG: hypothetical protein JXM73_13975 [Anaerolineae bacterium]|nr:hypothetical protein [Anaerolineae bacterium]